MPTVRYAVVNSLPHRKRRNTLGRCVVAPFRVTPHSTRDNLRRTTTYLLVLMIVHGFAAFFVGSTRARTRLPARLDWTWRSVPPTRRDSPPPVLVCQVL